MICYKRKQKDPREEVNIDYWFWKKEKGENETAIDGHKSYEQIIIKKKRSRNLRNTPEESERNGMFDGDETRERWDWANARSTERKQEGWKKCRL